MRKYLFPGSILLIAATTLAASSFTTHYNLEKPRDGSTSWGSAIRDDMDVIDTQMKVNETSIANHEASSAAHTASKIVTLPGASLCVSALTAQAYLDCLDANVGPVLSGGAVTLSGSQTLTGPKTFSALITGSGGFDFTGTKQFSDLSTGLLHSDATGVLSSSLLSNADVDAAAAIDYSKLNLSNSIVNADIAAGAAISDSKLAAITTAGKVANSATTAASANTADAIVARDVDGNFSAGTITAASFAGPVTGAVTGNVTGNLTGNVTGNVTGNLTGDVTGNLTGNVAGNVTGNVSGSAGSAATLTGNLSGDVTSVGMVTTISNLPDSKLAQISSTGKVANSATSAATANAGNTIVLRDNFGNFSAGTISATLNGNASTATTATTASTATTATNFSGSLSGDASGTQSAVSVNKIKGVLVDDAAKADGRALVYKSSSGNLEYSTVSSSGASKNFVTNPSADGGVTNWTTSNVTRSRDTSAGNKINGIASFSLTFANHTATFTSDAMTLDDNLIGQNCEAQVQYKGDASKWKFALVNASSAILTSAQLTNETGWRKATLNYPCASNYSLQIISTATSPADINVGGFYWGAATNIGSVSQAEFVSKIMWANGTAVTGWQDIPTATVASFSSASYNQSQVTNGSNVWVAPKDGYYDLKYSVSTAANGGSFDGRGVALGIKVAGSGPQAVSVFVQQADTGLRHGTWSGYLAKGTTVSLMIYYNTSGGTYGEPTLNVMRFPTAAEQAIRVSDVPTQPTSFFVYASSTSNVTGTYTPPAFVKFIKVRMVGGGGGGQASATAGWGTSGGNGGNTTFSGGGISLTAYGGSGGATTAGNAGGVGVTGWSGNYTAFNGGIGGGGQYKPSSDDRHSGAGGNSFFGGAGGSALGGNNGYSAGGLGSGGSGGALGAATLGYVGAGGGAGGFIELTIPNPKQYGSFSYQVGGYGAGASGTFSGGNGSAGALLIEEFYGTDNAPLLVGSVTSNSSGLERVERATLYLHSASPAIVSQSGSWLSTPTAGGAAGNSYFSIASGIFSAAPSCTCTPLIDYSVSTTAYSCSLDSRSGLPSTSTLRLQFMQPSNNTKVDGYVSVVCMGPR